MNHEEQATFDLVARLADRFGPASKVSRELPRWLEYLASVECPERPATRSSTEWWKKMQALAKGLVPAEPGHDTAAMCRNAALFGGHFQLTPTESVVLKFFVLHKRLDGFRHVVSGALETGEVTPVQLVSWFCGCAVEEVRAALRPANALLATGLLQSVRFRNRDDMPFEISDRLLNALTSDADDIDALIGKIFPPAIAPEADWRDFAGMASDAELMRDMLTRALSVGRKGVNILLYGPPGTGKTELAKVLAREIGAKLLAIGEHDQEGDAPSRHERCSELLMAGRLLATRQDTVLLFDEMEDFFVGASIFPHDRPSKVHTNRLLESNPIPVIWTANSVRQCDPAFLRRMSYSVRMRVPSGAVRGQIWQRLSERSGIALSPDAVTRLARSHNDAPALVSDAMQIAKLCDGGEEVLTQMLSAATRLATGVDPAPTHHSEVAWQSDLARTDVDLARVEARLAAPDAPRRVSFCLEGPAGTGKSAWARHLARCMGLPVIEKRASDLLSKWLGDSERNIADAFADARAENALLIFDEADSLLADRRQAERSWEISQVNEMLTWMENHPLPFVCTTNFVQRLDPATQRRFTFRIRFDWLSPTQLPLAWAAHFPGAIPAGLVGLDRLTPGDFANVSRRMRALGDNDPVETLRQLTAEVEAKEGAPRPIGFAR